MKKRMSNGGKDKKVDKLLPVQIQTSRAAWRFSMSAVWKRKLKLKGRWMTQPRWGLSLGHRSGKQCYLSLVPAASTVCHSFPFSVINPQHNIAASELPVKWKMQCNMLTPSETICIVRLMIFIF